MRSERKSFKYENKLRKEKATSPAILIYFLGSKWTEKFESISCTPRFGFDQWQQLHRLISIRVQSRLPSLDEMTPFSSFAVFAWQKQKAFERCKPEEKE